MSTVIWRLFMMKNRSGFTLAEVLVTLGVIGVVAVMTIPTLVTSYQKQGYVAALQKNYSMLSQTFEKYLSDQRVERLTETELTTLDGVGEFLNNYFKVTKDCGIGGANSCFETAYKKWTGDKNVTISNTSNYYAVILANGAAIAMGKPVAGIGIIFIDVNGKKGPNIAGRDFFKFRYVQKEDDKTIKVTDVNGKIDESLFDQFCAKKDDTSGDGCLSKIILDGWKMNY